MYENDENRIGIPVKKASNAWKHIRRHPVGRFFLFIFALLMIDFIFLTPLEYREVQDFKYALKNATVTVHKKDIKDTHITISKIERTERWEFLIYPKGSDLPLYLAIYNKNLDKLKLHKLDSKREKDNITFKSTALETELTPIPPDIYGNWNFFWIKDQLMQSALSTKSKTQLKE